jgi:fibronectin-binding autotransporter adhesin
MHYKNAYKILASGFLALGSFSAHATLATRYQVTQNGGFVLIGNTLAQDAASSVPAPVVGTVGAAGTNTSDTAPDIFWRSNSPATGQAEANTGITAANARSQAVLNLPSGSTITHAQLYWSATSPTGAAGTTATFSREGGFSQTITADASVTGVNQAYQSTADITALVQAQGPGTFSIGDISTLTLANINSSNVFANWSLAVVYADASEPARQITLQDGLDVVTSIQQGTATISRPSVGTGTALLGIVAYEGDNVTAGDGLSLNDIALSNASNPANNIFNSTYTRNGVTASAAGDLPQLTGAPGSMSGIDLDTFDITDELGTSTLLNFNFTSSGGDVYHVGALLTALPVEQSQTTPSIPEPGSLALLLAGGGVYRAARRPRGKNADRSPA